MEKIDVNVNKEIVKDKNADINQYTCPICLNLLERPVQIECKHTFCSSCLDELLENNPKGQLKCPMCRKVNNKISYSVNKTVENYIKTNFPTEYASRVKALEEYLKSQEGITKIKIIYGNTHELVTNPKSSKSDKTVKNSHKWSCFVKILGQDSSKFIRKVQFGLHPTFGTTEIDVKSAPFQMTRIGWGTFEIPIKIFWHYEFGIKEPLELEHCLSFEGTGESKVYIFKIEKKKVEKIIEQDGKTTVNLI
jgi:hypothetical protein